MCNDYLYIRHTLSPNYSAQKLSLRIIHMNYIIFSGHIPHHTKKRMTKNKLDAESKLTYFTLKYPLEYAFVNNYKTK